MGLIKGKTYIFKIADFVTPLEEVIGGDAKVRKYIKTLKREGIDFYEVEKSCGKRHLIAVETVEGVEIESI